MFDSDIMRGVEGVLATLHRPTDLASVASMASAEGRVMIDQLEDIAECNPHLRVSVTPSSEEESQSVRIIVDGTDSGIEFRTVPKGNLLSAFLYAVINAAGTGYTLDKELLRRASNISKPVRLVTYVGQHSSFTPRALQVINEIVSVNPNITNLVIDAEQGREDMHRFGIQSVPALTCNDTVVTDGGFSAEELLKSIEHIAA